MSAAGYVAIAGWESYRETSYYATEHERQQGISTIGFGETRGVQPGDRTTVERAMVQLLETASEFEAAVRRCAPVPMHQWEYDSFVSLTVNIGPGAFCRSTLAKKLNAGDYAGACAEILRWDRQGGVQLRGLTKRRQQEHAKCLGN